MAHRRALALIGFMGSGKSLVGERAAEHAGAKFHDLDRMIEKRAGRSIAEIFALEGEPRFRQLEKELLPEALEPGSVAALGGGALIDPAAWSLATRLAQVVFIEVPFEILWARIAGRPGRPLIQGRSREEVKALFEERRSGYLMAEAKVDGTQPVEHVAAEVVALWSD